MTDLWKLYGTRDLSEQSIQIAIKYSITNRALALRTGDEISAPNNEKPSRLGIHWVIRFSVRVDWAGD